MPQINRIRIINFSYNNDKRHIIDESFNFYRGENALLSLKNGGGKSVLIQLIMQPLIPMVKIQGRSIKDFFKRKKTPTYVLVEWKLDDMGGYLLTGICISNREVQVRENQDTENSIKYFTFTTQYSDSNLYDIGNIPLCKREANNIFIVPFKEAADLIQEKSRDSKFDIEYYAQDDGTRYGTNLMSFNISQDEWRNIIAKINSDEGGVIEIFEKCKTAQQLMHEWMIKTVEKVIYKDREDHRKLELMLENLVEEMIGNEQFIHEKSVLEQFLNQMGEFGIELEELIKGFDEQNKVEIELSVMHRYLAVENVKTLGIIDQNREAVEEENRIIRMIDLEYRSLDFYEWKDKFDRLQLEHEDIIEKLSVTNSRLEGITRQRDAQKVAEIYADIKLLKTELVSIEEEILKVKGQGLEQDKINRLEYSLKLAYKTKLSSLIEQIKKATEDIKTQEDQITLSEKRENGLNKQNEELNRQMGILEKSKEDFIRDEAKVISTVGFTVNRNLFGEADSAELEKTKKMLQEKCQTFVKGKGNLENSLSQKQERQKEIKNDKAIINQENTNAIKIMDDKEREREQYHKIEEVLKSIFLRHGLDFEKRFNHEENQRELRNIIDDLRGNQFEFQGDLSNIRNTMDSLKKGTLHASDEFALFLEASDINFETGENYLRKQHKDLREGLLKNIPLLPYAFILTDADVDKLKDLNPEHHIYQLIPIISYASLKEAHGSNGKLIDMGKGTSLLCLYNQRMIDADDIEDYFKELENESNDLAHKLDHYTELLESAQRDFETISEFKFDKGYLHKIELQLSGLIKKNQDFEENIVILEKEYSEHEQTINNIYQSISDIERRIDGAGRNIILFEDYLVANKEFQENNTKYDNCRTELDSLRLELEELKNLNKIAMDTKHLLEGQLVDLKREKNMSESNYNKYKNADVVEILEQDIESMEARLAVLRSKITSTLVRLERDQESRNRDINRKQKEISKFKLGPDEYINMIYDFVLLEALERQIQDLQILKSEHEGNERNIGTNKQIAESQMLTAMSEVKKLAEIPVQRNEIRMDFDRRRKDSKKVIAEKQKESEDIDKIYKLYSKIITEIEINTDVRDVNPEQIYVVSTSVKEDFDTLAKELKSLKHTNGSHERIISNKYIRMVNEYKDKNSNIANIFKGLDPIKQQAEEDPEKYYYLYERTINQKDVLGDLIRIYKNQLENLERNKNDMVTQSYLHAMQLYEEVQKITRDSAIKLTGKSRPVAMLRINMVLPEEGDRSMGKMRSYIDLCVNLVKDDMKKDRKQDEIRKSINKYMSSWEILNVISDLSKLVIEAYKVDININNSQYKTWEQVMKENSGGERFVSFFAVLAALMSYTRTSGRNQDDYVRNRDTKVLIMDNPFGPISSEHLLKPLFEIAKKYNTQLICLTDLKQNSILNCFNLIYMLKIRTSTLGTNEYLKVEEQIREGSELEMDENLEKAVFRAEDYVQTNLM